MTQDNFIGYLIGYGVAFLIGTFITRAIFSIPKFLRLQKAQLQVLTEIALKQGVKTEVLRSIHAFQEVDLRETTNEEKREELEKARKEKMTALEKEALSHPKE